MNINSFAFQLNYIKKTTFKFDIFISSTLCSNSELGMIGLCLSFGRLKSGF